jgi:ferritin-like metal-binding protein YciE
MQTAMQKLIIDELLELLSLERQLLHILPGMMGSAQGKELKDVLGIHTAEVARNIERLSECLRYLDLAQAKINQVSNSIAHATCLECMRATVSAIETRDIRIITSLRRLKHHTIATCESMRQVASSLDKHRILLLLTTISGNETRTDEALNRVCEFILNPVFP